MEVIAATFLVSIALLAIVIAAMAGRGTQDRTAHLADARAIAQSRIEQMRAISFNSIPSLAGTTKDSSLPAGNSISVTISAYPNSSVTDMYKGTVTVTWPEVSGTRGITYETLISRW